MKSKSPQYPITVADSGSGESQLFTTEEELVTTLEWFNSDDPEYNAVVTDALGRAVQLKIERLEVVICRLSE